MYLPNPTPSSVGQFTSVVDAVCKIRTVLLDRLAETLERMGRTKLALKTSLDDLDAAWAECIEEEVLRLRGEAEVIRAELGSHRATHGC